MKRVVLGFILLCAAVLVLGMPGTAQAENLAAQPKPGIEASPALTLTIPGIPPAPIVPMLPNPLRRPGQPPVVTVGPVLVPSYYYVRQGDYLSKIAASLDVNQKVLMEANGMTRPDTMEPGFVLRVPDPAGNLPPWAAASVDVDGNVLVAPRKSAFDRMTPTAQAAGPDSPFYNKTWVTYYGRPGIALMGIIGEHSAAEIMPLIKAKAAEYDAANGPKLGVQPAVHLVWGMATVEDQPDNSHLAYLDDATVMDYIQEGLKNGVDVILDSQIANLSPSASISPALPYLAYPNVHLAIDPEFAVSYKGQRIPGNPIGYITAEQVNAVEQEIADYMRAHNIKGKRILMVHQFQADMIVNKEKLDAKFPEVELTLSVDGFGNPYVKTAKYNALVDQTTPFTSFKLFYNWDEPLMTPRQALGEDGTEHTDFIEITPNMIQYQ